MIPFLWIQKNISPFFFTVVLLANKCDLLEEDVTENKELCEKLDNLCKENGILNWFATSAKKNINVENSALSLINKIHESNLSSNLEPSQDTVNINDVNNNNNQVKKGCCD